MSKLLYNCMTKAVVGDGDQLICGPNWLLARRGVVAHRTSKAEVVQNGLAVERSGNDVIDLKRRRTKVPPQSAVFACPMSSPHHGAP
jgi:hypothetical protein